jgi:predicted nucleotidyltransferase
MKAPDDLTKRRVLSIAEPTHRDWQGEVEVDEETFIRVLSEAIAALDDGGVPYVLMGGIGSATHGRPRWTHDVDFFVRPDDAKRALAALAGAGFVTQETDPHWLFKGLKDRVLVDIIFRSRGDVYLDEEMLSRAPERNFKGQRVRTIPPEDLLIIKAIVNDENLPRHWYDALAIVSQSELDWSYLISKAQRYGPRRVLSLLLYAQSNDLTVPNSAIRELFDAIYG